MQLAEQFSMQPPGRRRLRGRLGLPARTGPRRNPMDVMAPLTAAGQDQDRATQLTAAVTSEHTLKIEAARAGVSVAEYQARLRRGLLWCYRCRDWHQADAFPA